MANCKVCGKTFTLIEWFTTFNQECYGCEKKRIQESRRAVESPNEVLDDDNANQLEAYHEGNPQWIYPSKLLDTPRSAFDFPEYLGLSVAMRLFTTVGKITWMILFYLGFLVLCWWNLIV